MAQGVKANIPQDQVEKLGRLGCSNREIGDFFSVTEGCIRRHFTRCLVKCRSERKAKLRQLMWESAGKGNIAMQIWLSKNELGMSEKVEQTTVEKQTVKVILD
jgi:hypothetical protein